MVRWVVRESLQEREAHQPRDSPPEPLHPTLGEDLAQETWDSSQPSRPFTPLSGSESDLEDPSLGFEYALIPSLVKAVREALSWEDPVTSPPKQRTFFKQLNKERQYFPFLSELGGIISDKWSKMDKKSSMQSKVLKLYPFKEEVKHLESAPLVDAALMRLVRYITLPLKDTVSFKDPLERWIDSDLKSIYLRTGMACKPVLAVAAVSKAMEIWSDSVDETLRGISSEVAKSSPIQEIRLASAFLGKASIDGICLMSRVMLAAVTARYALWLRPEQYQSI